MTEERVLINMFEASDAGADEFVAAWEQTRDCLTDRPAHLGTPLHRAIKHGADSQFVNIALWRSAEGFPDAISTEGFPESAAGLRGRYPSTVYRVVHTQDRG